MRSEAVLVVLLLVIALLLLPVIRIQSVAEPQCVPCMRRSLLSSAINIIPSTLTHHCYPIPSHHCFLNMPRATPRQRRGGASHRSAALPANNAANSAGTQQTTPPQQAITEYPREIPDSQGDTQDDTEHPREIPDSQDDPADYSSSIGEGDDLGRHQPDLAHGPASLDKGEDLDGYETEEDPDPERTRQDILNWLNTRDLKALAPTQVPSEASTVEVLRSKPPYVSSHTAPLLKS